MLIDILTYHVFAGYVSAGDAVALAGSSVDMLNNTEMTIDVENGEVVLNMGGNRESMVIITDIIAGNGVIHVIDAVLDLIGRAYGTPRLQTVIFQPWWQRCKQPVWMMI